jgi:hypothetical protein
MKEPLVMHCPCREMGAAACHAPGKTLFLFWHELLSQPGMAVIRAKEQLRKQIAKLLVLRGTAGSACGLSSADSCSVSPLIHVNGLPS